MLYHLYDWQHAAFTPLRLYAESLQIAFEHPMMPAAYTRAGRATAAFGELVERGTRRYAKPTWGIDKTEVEGHPVDVEIKVEHSTPFVQLLKFHRAVPAAVAARQPSLLIVAPMSGHHATLLRGTVQALLPHANIYITDWVDARLVPLAAGQFNLEDYTATVIDLLQHIGLGAHVMAVCQPAVPVLAAVSLMATDRDPCRPRSMILMGGPVDTDAAPTDVTRFARSKPMSWISSTLIQSVPFYHPGGLRRVYPGFLQLMGFMAMNPDRHLSSHMRLFEQLVQGDGDGAEAHRRFYNEYLSVMDLTAEFYLQTVEWVYHDRRLPRGSMHVHGTLVEPGRISDTALLTVEGELDDICAPGQTEAAQAMCAGLPASMKSNHLQAGVGHYGIFNGRRWREKVAPRVVEFMNEHSSAKVVRLAG